MEDGFNRRVATLAARVALGVDTFEDLDRCVGFNGTPLLTLFEVQIVKQLLRSLNA